MARLNNLFLVLLVLCLPEVLADSWNMAPGTGAHGAGFPAIEGFEGTGIPNALWTDFSNGGQTVNWDGTTSPAPIAGAESLLMVDSVSGTKEAFYNFPGAEDEIWVAFRFKDSADPATFYSIMLIFDAPTNILAQIRLQTNGSLNGLVTTTPGTQIIDIVPGTSYRIKCRWKKATVAGNDEEFQVWAGSEATGAWGTPQIQQNGTTTAQADAISFSNPAASNHDTAIDNVMVSTSDIPWSALD
jgi:hypothetical protein